MLSFLEGGLSIYLQNEHSEFRVIIHTLLLVFSLVAAESDGAHSKIAKFYDPGHIVNIDIKMAQWAELENATPAGGRCKHGYREPQYEWHKLESIAIDDQIISDAGIKKKSYCGSFSRTKPSFNLDFGKYCQANKNLSRNLNGTHKTTLNNSIQDRSFVRQCLAYRFFTEAGIPSPLCSFAHVKVNGKDYGVYVHLERIEKPFFSHHYGTIEGNRYEAHWYPDLTVEHLSNLAFHRRSWSGSESLSDIQSLIAVIEGDESPELYSLQKLIDMDQFLRFWAAEMLINHWDGLTNDFNNAYLFIPENGQVQFIPAGTDQVLNVASDKRARQKSFSFLLEKGFTGNALCKKLYASPLYRERLHETMRELLATVWNEDDLIQQVDYVVALIEPHVLNKEKARFKPEVEYLKAQIKERRAIMSSMLSNLSIEAQAPRHPRR